MDTKPSAFFPLVLDLEVVEGRGFVVTALGLEIDGAGFFLGGESSSSSSLDIRAAGFLRFTTGLRGGDENHHRLIRSQTVDIEQTRTRTDLNDLRRLRRLAVRSTQLLFFSLAESSFVRRRRRWRAPLSCA